MHIRIITGASKGIGKELYRQFAQSGDVVFGLARTNPEQHDNFYTVDITDYKAAEEAIKEIIRTYSGEASSFTLINNAGVIEPIGFVGSLPRPDLAKAIEVNLTGPISLTNCFIRELESFEGKKNVLNISSGAGRKTYEGWSIYCTTKAGLDHFSQVTAVEQRAARHPVGIVSIAPGIIDTNMQQTIRTATEEQFPQLKRFVEYKEEGLLSSPEATAERLMTFIRETNFLEAEVLADLRNV